MIEIERKFLVKNTSFIQEATKSYSIEQGFLNTHPERCVRIRIKDNNGYITVKGKGDSLGRSRFEWEKIIPKQEAISLLLLCEPYPVKKIRYEIPFGKHLFEVDVFTEHNDGLIIAEVELSHPEETFEIPLWLGEEVTGNEKYYNSSLSKLPYSQWK